MLLWKKWIIHTKKNEIDPNLSSVTKSNWKWIEDLNVTPETSKALEESMEKHFKTLVEAIIFNKTSLYN
jgi:hypothetical protein